MELSQQRQRFGSSALVVVGESHVRVSSNINQYFSPRVANEQQMVLLFWKRSGPPDGNLNKYAIRVGNASGVLGSAVCKHRRDTVEMRAVMHEEGMSGGGGGAREDKQVMFQLQVLFGSKQSASAAGGFRNRRLRARRDDRKQTVCEQNISF